MKEFNTIYQELYQKYHDTLETLRNKAFKKRIILLTKYATENIMTL